MGGNKCLNVEKANELLGHHAVRNVIRTGLPGLPLLQQCLGTGPGLSQPRLLHTVQTQNKVHPYAKNLAQGTPGAESFQSHSPPATVSTMSPSG